MLCGLLLGFFCLMKAETKGSELARETISICLVFVVLLKEQGRTHISKAASGHCKLYRVLVKPLFNFPSLMHGSNFGDAKDGEDGKMI